MYFTNPWSTTLFTNTGGSGAMDELQMEIDTPEETGQHQGGDDKTEKQGETSQQ